MKNETTRYRNVHHFDINEMLIDLLDHYYY